MTPAETSMIDSTIEFSTKMKMKEINMKFLFLSA